MHAVLVLAAVGCAAHSVSPLANTTGPATPIASVELVPPTTSAGDFQRDVVLRMVRRQRATLEACYQHELDLDPTLGEQATGRDGVRGRHAQAVEIGELLLRRVLGHGRLEGAAGETELRERGHLRVRLGDEVRARDPEVDDAVLHVLRNVRRAHEQQVDRRVRAGPEFTCSKFPKGHDWGTCPSCGSHTTPGLRDWTR